MKAGNQSINSTRRTSMRAQLLPDGGSVALMCGGQLHVVDIRGARSITVVERSDGQGASLVRVGAGVEQEEIVEFENVRDAHKALNLLFRSMDTRLYRPWMAIAACAAIILLILGSAGSGSHVQADTQQSMLLPVAIDMPIDSPLPPPDISSQPPMPSQAGRAGQADPLPGGWDSVQSR